VRFRRELFRERPGWARESLGGGCREKKIEGKSRGKPIGKEPSAGVISKHAADKRSEVPGWRGRGKWKRKPSPPIQNGPGRRTQGR